MMRYRWVNTVEPVMANFLFVAIFDWLESTIHLDLQLLLVQGDVNGTVRELTHLLDVDSTTQWQTHINHITSIIRFWPSTFSAKLLGPFWAMTKTLISKQDAVTVMTTRCRHSKSSFSEHQTNVLGELMLYMTNDDWQHTGPDSSV